MRLPDSAIELMSQLSKDIPADDAVALAGRLLQELGSWLQAVKAATAPVGSTAGGAERSSFLLDTSGDQPRLIPLADSEYAFLAESEDT